jgi:hypothetical protein
MRQRCKRKFFAHLYLKLAIKVPQVWHAELGVQEPLQLKKALLKHGDFECTSYAAR